MKKWLKQYLMGFPLNAWQRDEISDAVEAMYQAKRREIITQTFIITAVLMGIISSIIIAYAQDIYALLG